MIDVSDLSAGIVVNHVAVVLGRVGHDPQAAQLVVAISRSRDRDQRVSRRRLDDIGRGQDHRVARRCGAIRGLNVEIAIDRFGLGEGARDP
ncbi:MAG: hypothetical protein ABIS51_05925, partial [Sphingomonas sp.]